jgi:Raf kinase inhibitor-like YbhB/YbcL family protein
MKRRMCSLYLIGLLLITMNAFSFQLSSKKITQNGKMPDIYTCEKGNISPALNWQDAPAQTKSFALTLSSLDTPVGKIYLWVLYNIPINVTSLSEGAHDLSRDMMIGKNSLGAQEYRGPCPLDNKVHRFVITVYALDKTLDLLDGAEVEDVMKNMQGHILGEASLNAVFSH